MPGVLSLILRKEWGLVGESREAGRSDAWDLSSSGRGAGTGG